MEQLLTVSHLKKYFDVPAGQLHAVDDVSFTIQRGETLGVVGESGCGKSTLGRVLLGLHQATSGDIIFQGMDLSTFSKEDMIPVRREMQIIFQDPYASLDPRFTVAQIIEEPLRLHKVCNSAEERRKRVEELMEMVGLPKRAYNLYPHEFDGGRRQRIGVARALALNPELIVCDEPVSALDVSIQAQVLNLLQDLQEEKNLSYIFVTHDMSVVKHISDDILVMYVGSMVEKCPAKKLFQSPLHPYTKGLLSAIPVPSIRREKKRIIMQGELTSPVNPKPGCRFANRCPYAKEKCHQELPQYEEVAPEHFVACHYVREINGMD